MRERYLKDLQVTCSADTNVTVIQKCPERPVIFIGHCLGGLVMQQVSLDADSWNNIR